MTSRFDMMSEIGDAWASDGEAVFDNLYVNDAPMADADSADMVSVRMVTEFCYHWRNSGRVLYQLSHSIAALLSATRSPTLDLGMAPFESFIVMMPAEYLPPHDEMAELGNEITVLVSGPQRAIGVLGAGEHVRAAWVFDPEADTLVIPGESIEPSIGHTDKSARFWNMIVRAVSNTIAYISEHKDAVERTSGPMSSRSTYRVSPPRDVIITRDFRSAVSALVSAGTIGGMRRALAHVVRGHWRNQPVGEGRKERRLTWVRPHKRGDENLGNVVRRIERINPAPLGAGHGEA